MISFLSFLLSAAFVIISFTVTLTLAGVVSLVIFQTVTRFYAHNILPWINKTLGKSAFNNFSDDW